MSEPFIAEIRMFGGNYAPVGYAKCDGQLLSIAQNTAMFSIMGTTYGGDGEITFGLPDLRGRVPMHHGNGPGLTNRLLGSKSGNETVTLSAANLGSHAHTFSIPAHTGEGQDAAPSGNYLAAGEEPTKPYADSSNASLGAGTTGSTGNGTPVNNMQPYLAINFIIALYGLWPSAS